MKVAILVGSLRAGSFNLLLSRALSRMGPHDWTWQHIAIDDLPLYNQDHDAAMPAESKRLKQEIEAADALMFVTPEYNRSIPGVLKNAIDIASRPYGKNSFAGKPAGVIGTSVGAIGTALAQQHLRNMLAYLDVPTLNQPEAFLHFREGLTNEAGEVTDEKTRDFLQRWMNAYQDFVRAHAKNAR